MVVRSLLTLLGFKGDDKNLKKYGNALKGVLNVVKLTVGATLALAAAATKMAGDMEQVEIAFETMLGSAEKAEELIKDITDFAAKTPFELKGLVDSSKQLLAFGFAADEIIPTMTTLGNIAAGVGRDKLPTIVRSLGKIRTKGKASMEELNMMLEAGVPILDTLSEQLGVTNEELFKMISAGKVGFNDVNNALTSMGTGTGRFGGLMEKQSKSFLGILSNIGDWFTNFMIAIGKELLPIGKELGKFFLQFLGANEELMRSGIVKFIKGLIFGIAFVIRFIQRLIDRFGGLGNAFGMLDKFLKNIGNFGLKILKGIGRFILFIADAVNEVIDMFGGWGKVTDFLGGTLQVVGSILEWLFSTIGFILGLLIKFVGFIIHGLIKGVEKVINFFKVFGEVMSGVAGLILKEWEKFSGFFINLWKKIVNFFLGVGKVLKALWDAYAAWFTNLWKSIGDGILGIWDNIVNGIKGAWEGIVGFITGLWENLMGFIENVVNFGKGIADFFGGIFGGPETTIQNNTAGAGAGGNNINVKSNINIGNVPEGTPEEQAAYIKQNAKKAVREEWNSIMNEGITNLPQGVL